MSKSKKEMLVKCILNVEKLFQEKDTRGVSLALDEFEKRSVDCDKFYSLYARMKYIRSFIYRNNSTLVDIWFKESIICLSPNYLPYVPEDFFDQWLETLNLKNGRWIPKNQTHEVKDEQPTFLKVNGNFEKRYIVEGDPIGIEVSMISTLPKSIPDCSVAAQLVDSSNRKNFYTISEHQHIVPNKKLIFKSSIQPQTNTSKLIILAVALVINDIYLIFKIKYPTIEKIHIEPRDCGCTLSSNLPPVGFVNVPAPITLQCSSTEAAGYHVQLNFACSNAIVSNSPTSKFPTKTQNIFIKEPYHDYTTTIYVHTDMPQLVNIELTWNVPKGGKPGRIETQQLPLDFHWPFNIQTKIFNENRSIVPKNKPLLTESSYSLLTKLSINSTLTSWPMTIESFKIETHNDNIKFSDPIIPLPIELQPNDSFAAVTHFITGEKEEKTNLGKLLIRYNMQSTIYSGSHEYSYILPATENHIVLIERMKLSVKFDFPSRGSQFEMCELSIRLKNVSDTPIEIVLKILDSPDFFMAGTLNTQIGLFPNDPICIPLNFFPLNHGSLTFPQISIISAQDSEFCYWKTSPPIFISYSTAS